MRIKLQDFLSYKTILFGIPIARFGLKQKSLVNFTDKLQPGAHLGSPDPRIEIQ